MKNIIYSLFALFLALGFSSCGNDDICVRGNNRIDTEVRNIESFIGVCKVNSIDVEVYSAPYFEVVVTADDNIIPSILTYVSRDILHVELDGGCFRSFDARVEIYMPDIAVLESRGSGNMLVDGFFNIPDLTLDLSGSGDIRLIGSTEEFIIDKSGSGDVRAFDMRAEAVILDKSGSGDLEVFASDEILGEMSGSGDLLYRGFPIINLNKSGSGDIIDAN